MAAERIHDPNDKKKPRRPPATTPEDHERRLQSLAFQLSEKQLLDGTISATVLAALVRSGTTRERLEQERLMREVELLKRKAETLDTAEQMVGLYQEAIDAMRKYNGQGPDQGLPT